MNLVPPTHFPLSQSSYYPTILSIFTIILRLTLATLTQGPENNHHQRLICPMHLNIQVTTRALPSCPHHLVVTSICPMHDHLYVVIGHSCIHATSTVTVIGVTSSYNRNITCHPSPFSSQLQLLFHHHFLPLILLLFESPMITMLHLNILSTDFSVVMVLGAYLQHILSLLLIRLHHLLVLQPSNPPPILLLFTLTNLVIALFATTNDLPIFHMDWEQQRVKPSFPTCHPLD